MSSSEYLINKQFEIKLSPSESIQAPHPFLGIFWILFSSRSCRVLVCPIPIPFNGVWKYFCENTANKNDDENGENRCKQRVMTLEEDFFFIHIYVFYIYTPPTQILTHINVNAILVRNHFTGPIRIQRNVVHPKLFEIMRNMTQCTPEEFTVSRYKTFSMTVIGQ